MKSVVIVKIPNLAEPNHHEPSKVHLKNEKKYLANLLMEVSYGVNTVDFAS